MSSACIRIFASEAATSRPEDMPGKVVRFGAARFVVRVFSVAEWERLSHHPTDNVLTLPNHVVWFQAVQ